MKNNIDILISETGSGKTTIKKKDDGLFILKDEFILKGVSIKRQIILTESDIVKIYKMIFQDNDNLIDLPDFCEGRR